MIFRPIVRVALLSVFLLLGVTPAVVLANEVAAKVGGIPITKYELQREIQKILPLQVSFHGGISQEKIDKVRSEALQNLIQQAYKTRYALEEEISIDNKLVDEVLAPIRSKFKSQEDFEKALGGESLNAYRATIYRYLLAKKAEEVAVDEKIKVTDEQVSAYYSENSKMYIRPKRFKASHIMVKVDPASNEEERNELKKRAEELTARAKSGEDFYNLAYYNSDDRSKYVGGDLGYFHLGQTAPEFEEAIVKMSPGEISDPIKTRWGYHIVKLVEVDEPRQFSFEEAKNKIREALEKKERNALYQTWFNALKNKYQVEYFTD